MNRNIVIIGAGGHAKVIADIIEKSGDTVYGFLDDNKEAKLYGYKYYGNIAECDKIAKENIDIYFIIAIGNNNIRKQISNTYNLNYCTLIHPSAVIGANVVIGKGTAVMANVVINPSTTIGSHCILNTGCIIEHDNKIDDYVHISPNATLGGTVNVGECTHIAIGATVINNINIVEGCTIGAGAVVVKDIIEKGNYIGIPAKRNEV